MKVLLVISNIVCLAALFLIMIIFFPIVPISAAELSGLMPNIMSPEIIASEQQVTNNMFEIPLMPAAITFYIWIVIYIMLLYFVINQVFSLITKKNVAKTIDAVSWWYVLAVIVSIAWYFTWQYNYILYSLMLSFSLLIVLIIIYRRLHVKRINFSVYENLFVRLPFSVYLSWISVVFVLIVSYYLQLKQWHAFGLSDSTWTIIALVLLSLIAVLFVVTKRDFGYGAVIIWFLAGILIKRYSSFILYTNVVVTAWVCIAVITVLVVVKVFSPVKHSESHHTTSSPPHKGHSQQA